MTKSRWTCVSTVLAVLLGTLTSVEAATIYVAAGDSLQTALNSAQPGDTVVLQEGAEFAGNFVLPLKAGTGWITVRTSAPDPVLPPAGVRIQPSHAPLLARLRSPNSAAALRTAPGAHHWDIRYLEFAANQNGYGDVIQIGDGSSAQNSLDKVPHDIVLDHVYVHGDPLVGQKRGIALNASQVTIRDSYVSECKAVGQDTQAIGGWNGPGPYTIENNYLEAAGENFLLGGADPAIPGLVPDGVVFKRNFLSRPMSWRNPIIATPAGVTAAGQPGGSLAAGTYAYRVVARRTVGQGTMGRSTASTEVTATTTVSGSAVRVRWQAVPSATEYRVYGRTAGGQSSYWRVTGTEFVDTGAAGTVENVPTSPGTVWSVKNLFELKNARNVVVENNVLENHWKESQPGYAIVLTPRNSNGACTWCIIEHVRFESNVVRNVAAGINLLGYDIPTRPTQQSNDIIIRNNLFTGLTTSLGGNAWFLLIGDEPRNVTVDHNTIDATSGTLVNVYGGTSTDPREILGFQMIANVARHGNYGINGSFFSYGNGILNGFFPGAVFVRNYLAGGSASRYPAGNLFAGVFADQFVNAGVDYTIRADSALKGAAPDGSDLGIDAALLASAVLGVEAGVTPAAPRALIAPTADFTITCAFLSCTFTNSSLAGSGEITASTWTFGDGAETVSAEASHLFATAGTYTVTLSVVDADGLTGTSAKTVIAEAPVPPVASMTLTCTYLVCSFADASTAGSGDVTSRTWSFGDGTTGTLAGGTHAFAAGGTYTVTLTVADSNDLTSTTTRTVTVEPPNVAPTAAFVPVCTDLMCTFTDASTDGDGRIVSWSWGGSWSGDAVLSNAGSFSYTFAMPGTYVVTLVVTDDDGATSVVSLPLDVTALMHATLVNGSTTRWKAKTGATYYWSADVTLGVYGADQRPIAGATIAAAWSGALTKTVTCVTNAAGQCTFKSGTLSMLRSWVTLTVTGASAPLSVYVPSANVGLTGNSAGTAVTYRQP
jgi:PKD repeat protein